MERAGTFSLRTLFVLVTLTAVVSAAFVWDEFAGIFAYLGCLVLVMMVWRHRALQSLLGRPDPPTHLRLAGPDTVVLASIGIALAAAVAFCCACSFAQLPLVLSQESAATSEELARARLAFRMGLLVSIPIGTVAALLVYALFWPRDHWPKGPTLR